jgi:integrase
VALEGRDPLAERARARQVPTFEEAARQVHLELSPTWKNPKDRKAFLTTLEVYVFPRFGNVRLAEVTSADVRQAILAARERAPGVARKLVYRVSSVFKWGIAEGHCQNNPATTQALALPRETRPPRNRKSLPYSEVAHCVATVTASGAWAATKLALEFIVLTTCRSGEARLALWKEMDFDPNDKSRPATWTIPGERAKQGRSHRVPLSSRAVEILAEARKLDDGSGLVFPSIRGKALSDMTLSKLVKELGFGVDVHGFRTSFRTWAQEQTDYPREVQEAALGHKVGDAAEQAYARSDYFAKRREMMEDWAQFLSCAQEDEVWGGGRD